MIGQRFGRLVVVTNAQAGARWKVRCSCGTEEVRFGSDLRDRQRKGRLVACKACQKKGRSEE